MSSEGTVKAVNDAKVLIIDAIELLKSGKTISVWNAGALFKIMADLKVLLADAPAVFPELHHLSESDAEEITGATYSAIREIVDAARIS